MCSHIIVLWNKREHLGGTRPNLHQHVATKREKQNSIRTISEMKQHSFHAADASVKRVGTTTSAARYNTHSVTLKIGLE